MNTHRLVVILFLGSLSSLLYADPKLGLDEAEAAINDGGSPSGDFLEDADQRASTEADKGINRAREARSTGRSHALDGISRGREGYNSRSEASRNSSRGGFRTGSSHDVSIGGRRVSGGRGAGGGSLGTNGGGRGPR